MQESHWIEIFNRIVIAVYYNSYLILSTIQWNSFATIYPAETHSIRHHSICRSERLSSPPFELVEFIKNETNKFTRGVFSSSFSITTQKMKPSLPSVTTPRLYYQNTFISILRDNKNVQSLRWRYYNPFIPSIPLYGWLLISLYYSRYQLVIFLPNIRSLSFSLFSQWAPTLLMTGLPSSSYLHHLTLLIRIDY